MKLHFNSLRSKSVLLLALATMVGGANAGTEAVSAKDSKIVAPTEKEESVFDRIWGLATLYKNKDNPVIQEFSLTGRQNFDYYYVDSDDQGSDDDWISRRTRFGFQAKVFGDFTIKTEADFNLQDPDPAYQRLTDAYLKWAPSKEFYLTIGKHSARFTLDGSTPTTQLITIDRSNIANNFWYPEEYATGISIGGEVGNWIYYLGGYSGDAGDGEFSEFKGSAFGVASIGYNLKEALGADKAILKADFVYQDTDPDNTFITRANEAVASLNFVYEKGLFGFSSDVVGSKGAGSQPDLFGVQIMPSVFFNSAKTFQGVLRYTYINSDGDNGIRLARYENFIETGRGDQYNEIYAGLNYYIYGHKLKIQGGVQYTSLDDSAGDGGEYSGFGVTGGFRFYF